MAVWSWVSPDGVEFPFDGDLFVEGDTVEGLTGAVEDFPLRLVGRSGQVVNPGDSQVQPIEGGFTVVAKSPSVLKEFRGALSRSKQGVLRLRLDGGVFDLPARVGEVPPAPGLKPRRGTRLGVRFIGDGGVWLQPYTHTGNVIVTNSGDVAIWVKIRWQGAGGVVTMPSGATFTLPTVTSPKTLWLDPGESNLITNDDDTIDETLWKQLRSQVFPESIKPGESKTITTPATATVLWEVGYFDPWGV